ncbi:hypothetical protein GOBAR_DD07254 [Gossypium barbadense]|nr:hypothetical protein GOBAR_DD07254 [Gossypium barbadense]
MPICEAFAQIEQQLNICDEPLKLDILISFRIMVFIWVWTLRLRVFHLLFLFRFPSQHTDFCHDGEAELSLEFPDGTIPVTCVYQYMMVLQVKRLLLGPKWTRLLLLRYLLAASECFFTFLPFFFDCLLKSSGLFRKGMSHFALGIFIGLFASLGEELFFTVGGQHIPFGASPQDVWSELGRPCGIYHMQDDKPSSLA